MSVMPPVLDACCGSRMFWFDKGDPRALFLDKRREICTDPRGQEVVIDPDVLGDFTELPFADGTFNLVVFDPPHTFNGKDSAMAQKYGRLEPGWREQITAGFAECFRVLRSGGTLVFKWNEHRVPIKTVLAMTPETPLFGHRSGATAKTHWMVFLKTAAPPRCRLEPDHDGPCQERIGIVTSAEQSSAIVPVTKADRDAVIAHFGQFATEGHAQGYALARSRLTAADRNATDAGLREALAPFAAFADPRRQVPAFLPISSGSGLARRQLTMGDCYAAADALTTTEASDGKA